MSQIEIDRAKKDYGTVTGKYLDKLRAYEYNGELLLKKIEKRFPKNELSDNNFNELMYANIRLLKAKFYKDNVDAIDKIKQEIASIFKSDVTISENDEKYYQLKYQLGEAQYYKHSEDAIDKIEQEITALRNADIPFYKEIDELYELEYDLKEAQFCKDDDKIINQIEKEITDLCNPVTSVQKRPIFFKYCSEGERYAFKHFNTPMDYLQEVIGKIPAKKGKRQPLILRI